MFEKTGTLLEAIWAAVCRQDWVSIRGSLGLLHAFWAMVAICIVVGAVIYGLFRYFGWLRRRPIRALLCGFLCLSVLMGMVALHDYRRSRAAAARTRAVASASVNRDWVRLGTIPPGRKAKILSPTDVVVRDVWPGGSSISTGDIMTYAGRPFAIDISVRADTVNGGITFTLM